MNPTDRIPVPVASLLRCPVCGVGTSVTPDGKSLICRGEKPHCFDFARSGYLNLTPSHPGGGDDREMVRARTEFLSAGYYRPIADGVLRALGKVLPDGGTVLDAGCGEGYYSCRIVAGGYTVFGADLSKSAIDHAAKTARVMANASGVSSAFFAVSGLFDLPVADASFDAIVSIFAPVAEAEFLRVLKPGGYLILAGAGRDHLMGLKQALYDRTYQNEERADLPAGMREISRETVREEITVSGGEHIRALFSMTPYYWRTSVADRKKLDGLKLLVTPIDVQVLTYRKD